MLLQLTTAKVGAEGYLSIMGSVEAAGHHSECAFLEDSHSYEHLRHLSDPGALSCCTHADSTTF